MSQLLEEPLPQGWYSLKINSDINLYFSIEQNLASISPVFPLERTNTVLKEWIGLNIDFDSFE